MKKLKVTILIRIRIDGKQRYVPPVWLTKTVLKPGWAFVAPATLVRDEMANMVWGIEDIVPLPHGLGRSGHGAAAETRRFMNGCLLLCRSLLH